MAATACCTDSLEIRAASIRGFLHRARKGPRQDAFAVQQGNDDTVLVVVCDGVGSLPRSERAAQLICETLPGLYRDSEDWTKAITQMNELLREEDKAQVAEGADDRLMASTVTACRVRYGADGLELSYAWVGDSELWALDGGIWTPLIAASHDEDGLYSTRVSPLPTSAPVIRTGETTRDVDAVFLFTDGVSVPLAMGRDVQDALAAWWAVPPDPFAFARQVGFARRGFVDDRTAVGVWSRPRLSAAALPTEQASASNQDSGAHALPSQPPRRGEEGDGQAQLRQPELSEPVAGNADVDALAQGCGDDA
jgi:hypothetical protein